MIVQEVWQMLEQGTGELPSGYLMRRILPEVHYDVFLAIEKPSNLRLMMIQVQRQSVGKGIAPYPSSSSFSVRRVLLDEKDKDRVTYQLILTNIRYSDIFTTLVQDIVNHIAAIPEEDRAVGAFLTHLKRWQIFLERHNPEGLDQAAQQGLYGELWFLRHSVLPQCGAIRGVLSWSGPAAAQQDFQLERCAVEVKTTTSKQHQKLPISSERQLDETGTGALILLHLSLDLRQGRGETLPNMVAGVRSLLGRNPAAIETFEALLFETGYLDIHVPRYEQNGYTVRETNYFRVEGDFPRIIEADLRNGVGDVRYTIDVAVCKRFAITESEVLSLMGGQS
ncbi:PD-(D/E)XK motif protein [Leptolyngbya sp. ST-U4]|uniref:PD-(D/E)XK motif protein n=1 Tax=Leptolyngbya sp. ST-U4 TaxID=2933912 RepID=UPI00329A5A92